MISSRALNAHAPWAQILELLNVSPGSRALPALVTCPLCKKHRLNIYEDTISGGAWHYCADCGAAGDMIELCSAVWECSPAVAVRRIAEQSVPIPEQCLGADAIGKYVADYQQLRSRLRDLWRQCRDYLVSARSPDLARLMRQLRLVNTIPSERWADGPGQLLGAADHHRAETIFTPGILRGRNRTFTGGGWGEVLAIAFHDLPDRICGFLFVGRKGGQGDRIFRVPGVITRTQPRDEREAGLAGLHTIEDSRAMFQEHVIAVDDAFLAVRLQLRHFQTNNRPLPLVAYYDGPEARTKNGWRAVQRRRVVCWGWRLTPALLNQAIITDGLISLAPVDSLGEQNLDRYLRHDEPRILVRKIIKHAKPWRAALAEWAEAMPTAVVEDLLIGIERYQHDKQQFAPLSSALASVIKFSVPHRVCTIGRRHVVEKDGKWWSRCEHNRSTKEELLLGGVVRVEEMIAHADGQFTRRGHIYCNGDTVPFEFKTVERFQNALLRLRYLVIQQTQKDLYVAPKFGEKLLFDIAERFHTPIVSVD